MASSELATSSCCWTALVSSSVALQSFMTRLTSACSWRFWLVATSASRSRTAAAMLSCCSVFLRARSRFLTSVSISSRSSAFCATSSCFLARRAGSPSSASISPSLPLRLSTALSVRESEACSSARRSCERAEVAGASPPLAACACTCATDASSCATSAWSPPSSSAPAVWAPARLLASAERTAIAASSSAVAAASRISSTFALWCSVCAPFGAVEFEPSAIACGRS
mmetsp:Transcript_23591/g.58890  ORF Transcript_23591/g.58890 Transcript_23591/m.58890 type:complete len:227 (+) Transcript_23591:690-1370(+)